VANQYMIILRGIPGSGKSTEAKAMAKRDPNALVIGRDGIRWFLFGDSAAFGIDEDLVTKVVERLVLTALDQGASVIIDNTNTVWKNVEEFAAIAATYDIPVAVHVVDVGLTEALRRNRNRDRVVPDDVIKRMHAQLEETKDWTL
jgi:predicted kinase